MLRHGMWHWLPAAMLVVAAAPGLAADPRSPREVIEAKFAAVNRHAVDAVVAFYADDAQLTAPDFCAPRRGKANVERTYRGIFTLLPDVRVELTDLIAEGDRVAVRFVLRSDRAGPAFAMPIFNHFTVRGGLIVRDDGMFDQGGRPCRP